MTCPRCGWKIARGHAVDCPLARITAHVRFLDDGCWLWTGSEKANGYGAITVDGRGWRAHRYAYVAAFGAIAEGMELDHVCRNRRCVNPFHLRQVSHRENTLSGETITAHAAQQTHCKRGHELTPESVYENGRGRQCKQCARIRAAERYARATA